MDATLEQQVAGTSNVLVLGSMLDEPVKDVHNRLLSAGTKDGANVLALTFQSAAGWSRTWTRDPEGPGEVVIVTFSEALSSTEPLPDGVSAITVNPTDLTGVGMRLSDYLNEWDRLDAGTVVCFNSITELLQYTDEKPLYRFLRVLTRRIEHVGGFAHFHMDPSAHPERTLAVFRSVFDAIVDTTASEGEYRVRVR